MTAFHLSVPRLRLKELLLVAAVSTALPGTVAAQELDSEAARTILENAAEALGGMDAVMGAETMQLYGFAQLADGFGTANLTASGHAPQKWEAHNDFQLIWDLENERYMQRQRDNRLFPFAGLGAHDYSLNRDVLDGDLAYSLSEEGEAESGGNVRELRLWSLSYNPVLALQEALDEGSTLSSPRLGEENLMLVDVTLADGEQITLGFEWETGLPRSLTWTGPNHLLGEVRYTTDWTGFIPYNGLKLPLGLVTSHDWLDLHQYAIYGEGWIVNGEIPELAAPESVVAEVAAAAQAGEEPAAEVPVAQVTDGIWRVGRGSIAVEFSDHMLVFELGGFGYDDETQPVIDAINQLVPGKSLTHYVLSHHHDDHSSGLRTAVANGLTVISHYENEDLIRLIATRPAPNYPDMLHRNPQPLNFIPVFDHLRLEDEERTLDLRHVVAHGHMGSALFGYDPDNLVLIEADILPSRELQWWADAYLDNVDHYGLEVEIIASNHMGILDPEGALELLAPGRIQAQQHCLDLAAVNNYRVGCPPFYTRGGWIEGMSEAFDLPFETQ